MIVCLCKGVSDRTIDEVIDRGARTVGQVARACGAGTDCGSCACQVREMIQARRRPSRAGAREAVSLLARAAATVP